MDLPPELSGLATIGAGAGAAFAMVRAIASWIRGRGDATSASAKAVVELVAQLGTMRGDLRRMQAEVTQLRAEMDAAEVTLATERAARVAAEAWAKTLAEELAELRRAIMGGHTLPSGLPPQR